MVSRRRQRVCDRVRLRFQSRVIKRDERKHILTQNAERKIKRCDRERRRFFSLSNENVLCFYTRRISSPRCVCALSDRSNRVRFALSFVYFSRVTRRRRRPPRLRFVPFVTSPRCERIAGRISLLPFPRGSICARDEEDPLVLLFFPPPPPLPPGDDRKFTTRRTQLERERERERESAKRYLKLCVHFVSIRLEHKS